ncbi:DUF192 domain-containing protein [Pelistega ratti]|uniref:DUF192 domain-containing protein n=1 Tax=Pelistega ratti TaxID=2652177 RepID=UPI00135B1314|nr:DUF192 domain-containing protein [Pelistega ratti]
MAKTLSIPEAPPHTITLHFPKQILTAEIVNNSTSRAKGLMFRQNLEKNTGMLFVFPDSQRRCFWMKNTFIPLSIAYIDHHHQIIDILDLHPLDETAICSSKPAMFALEVNQGWFDQHHIRVGDTINIPLLSAY